MINRSQKYTISGVLTLLTISLTAGIGQNHQEGIPAQATEPVGMSQDAEVPERIFYRNGETKTITPDAEPVPEEWAPEQSEGEPFMQEPVVETCEEPTEHSEPEPLSEEELLIPPGGEVPVHEAAIQVAPSSGPSLSLIISGAVIAVIVLGAIWYGIARLRRRFRPTLSKEAIAPPPIAAEEPSLPRLETALGGKPDGKV